MPLDEATRRFAFLLQRDLRRLAERQQEALARGERLRFDSISRIALVETSRGGAVARLDGEVLATYASRDRILRWAWAGRSPNAAPARGDAVFREGQARGVPQLAMSVVGDLDLADARALVELGALVARAEAVHDRTDGGDVDFIGIFDRSLPPDGEEPGDDAGSPRPGGATARESRFSVPPPPVGHGAASRDTPRAGPAHYRSLPPVREIFEPRGSARQARSEPPVGSPSSPPPLPARASSSPPSAASRTVREPPRELFLPVASAALSALASASTGYVQALFVVTHEVREPPTPGAIGRKGIVVQLVVIDRAGLLRAVDPPAELVDAAARLVEADGAAGGRWRKLAARITPKPDGGASLHVDVT